MPHLLQLTLSHQPPNSTLHTSGQSLKRTKDLGVGSLHLEELQVKLRCPDCYSVFSPVFHMHDYVLSHV